MSTKIDIISGFLGSGKTTLIKKLIDEVLKEEKIAIIENEFGEIAIDGNILEETNIDIREIKSGCICCSLVGDFKNAVREVMSIYKPERIIIEPSGVAKLSDVINSCEIIKGECDIAINSVITVIDAINYEMYINNFGEFYKDQIESSQKIILSRTQETSSNAVKQVVDSIRVLNKNVDIITTPWDVTDSVDILKISEKELSISLENEHDLCHKNHHVHYADKVFETWGIETSKIFNESNLEIIFKNIISDDEYGTILRAKGVLEIEDKKWIQFHYIPAHFEISHLEPQCLGKICIIGKKLNKNKLNHIFEINL